MWNFIDIYEGILKHRIIDIEIDDQDIENLDLEGYEELHKALIDIRKRDPDWSINGTKRNLSKQIRSRDIGLPTNSSESEDEKTILEKADKTQMTAGELFEYEERLEKYNEQLAIEKELLKKE